MNKSAEIFRGHLRTYPGGFPKGIELLHDPFLNKGTAFSEEEREVFHLRGLLPPCVCTYERQIQRVMENYRRKPNDLEKYIHLISLQDRNETLFYRIVLDHLEEMMPIVYTPTVGQACLEYGHIFRRPRGLFITARDRGHILEVLSNWKEDDVRVIVVTDGERILGLGDLGADGMGIPVGKLSLYTVCAGIHPLQTLPVMLDVGTENEELLSDPLYLGLKQHRLREHEYDAFLDEFIRAVQERFPRALVQFEDFATGNAFRLLKRYRDQICVFNDDIQGTGGVVLAGLYSALRITGGKLKDQKYLFLGAGEAAIGIGRLLVSALIDEGIDKAEAVSKCWFIDSRGLVVKERSDLAEHKLCFAHDHPFTDSLFDALEVLKPTVLIGASGRPGMFGPDVIEKMAALNERPIIFALSNPTSKSECTAHDAYTWSGGRVIFASGSPFDPVRIGDTVYVPGQANNSYIFPGVGLGVVSCGATRVTDEMIFEGAKALARCVTDEDLGVGRIYPSLKKIREVSATIAAAVAEVAYESGLATETRPDDLYGFIQCQMYVPEYQSYLDIGINSS